MKNACLVMFVVFALFAYFQRNDLDEYNTQLWYVWVVIYGVCSVISLLSYFRALPRGFYFSFAIASLIASLVRASAISPGQNILFNEANPAGNEAGGFLVVALWFGVLAWKYHSLRKGKS